MAIWEWLFGYEGLFNYGFWAMALLDFFLPISLIENTLYSIFALVSGERKNGNRTILIGTIIISITCSSIGLALISDGLSGPEFSWLAICFIWSWYFVLVPQIIIRAILRKVKDKGHKKRHRIAILLRLALTVILPACLIYIHIILGSEVFGITPD